MGKIELQIYMMDKLLVDPEEIMDITEVAHRGKIGCIIELEKTVYIVEHTKHEIQQLIDNCEQEKGMQTASFIPDQENMKKPVGRWSAFDIQNLENNYGAKTSKEIGNNIGRSEKAVNAKLRRLGLSGGSLKKEMNKARHRGKTKHKTRWTSIEKQDLIDNYISGDSEHNRKLAEKNNRGDEAQTRQARRMGLIDGEYRTNKNHPTGKFRDDFDPEKRIIIKNRSIGR